MQFAKNRHCIDAGRGPCRYLGARRPPAGSRLAFCSMHVPPVARGRPSACECAGGHAEALDCGLVDLDAQPRPGRKRDRAIGDRRRRPGEVLGKIEMGQAHAPIDRGRGAGEVDRGRRRDARFRDLGGDVDGEPEAFAQLRCLDRRAMPPSLISLSETPPTPQRSCASISASEWMPSSAPIGIGAIRVSLASAAQIVVGERLLDEHEAGGAHAFDIAAGVGQASARNWRRRRAALRRPAHRAARASTAISPLDRLGADLELEEIEALRALGVRLGDVLLRRRIAEQPHRRDRRGVPPRRSGRRPAGRRIGRRDRAAPSRSRNGRRCCRRARS